jgi:hypothetical protein
VGFSLPGGEPTAGAVASGSVSAQVGEDGVDTPVVGGAGGEAELGEDVTDVRLDRVRVR